MKNRTIITVVFLILFPFFAGCSDQNERGPERQIIISVDQHVLTLAQFNQFFEPLKMNYATKDDDEGQVMREARLRFLVQLVEEMVILRRAEELGLDVSPLELQEALGDIGNDYSEESFNDMFMKQAISRESWEERLKRQILVKKTILQEVGGKISITPEEIRTYYDEHLEEWSHGEQVRVRQILLNSKKEADQVLQRLKDGEGFAALARRYSQAPEAELGGDMGYAVRGHLPKPLEDPVFALKEETLSPVIKTIYGYHIFQVVDRRPGGKPNMDDWIEVIRERVKKGKIETAYGPWLTGLKSRYKISVNKEII